MEKAIIKVNNVKSKITGLSSNALNLLSRHLTVRVPNFQYATSYRNGTWDGTQKFLVRPANVFPTGLIPKVVKFLQKTYSDIDISFEDYRPNNYVIFPVDYEFKISDEKILRDYQVDTINNLANNKVQDLIFYRGIVNIATNGGKTVIAEGIIKELFPQLQKNNGVFLFITHSKEIAYQTQRSIEKDLGIKTGFIGDGKWEVKPVTIAITTTMYRRMKDMKVEFFELEDKVAGVIVDECLSGDTEILLPNNKSATIKQICESTGINEVVSYNLEKQTFENKPIIRKIITPNKSPFLKIEYTDPTTRMLKVLKVTGSHKIWTPDKQYIRADILTKNDILKFSTDNFSNVKIDKIITNNKEIEAFKYNLEIADNHNYFANKILVSNCHHVSATSFQEVLNCFDYASIRVGLTGTVDKSNPVNEMKLYSCVGPIIKRISNNYLIKKGVSAKPICLMFKISNPDLSNLEYQDAYTFGIVKNYYRHQIIYDICNKETNDGNKVLILVERLDHGQILEEILSDLNKEVYFTNGQLGSSDRELLLNKLREGKLDILISSNILDEGVDVSGINAIIYARGMRSMRKLLQGIGRGLRLKEDKSNLRFYDFVDNTNLNLLIHSKERYETLTEEQFDVKLLNSKKFLNQTWEEIMG